MQSPYTNVDIEINRVNDTYVVEVESAYGQAEHRFTLPFSEQEMEIFFLRIGKNRGRTVRGIEKSELKEVKRFGGTLFEMLFGGSVRDCLRTSQANADAQGQRIRFRVRVNNAPELADLPWEFLYDKSQNRFLVLSVESSLVRYLEMQSRVETLAVAPPLHLLVVIASPTDFISLDVEKEWHQLQEGLKPLVANGKLILERLDKPTMAELRQELRRRDYHILHFIGHGGFDSTSQEGQLLFEDNRQRSHPVSGQDLGVVLYDHRRSLRLVVLNACEGARPSRNDPFAGVAQSLVQQGVPAVIAMQFEISDDAALLFSYEFYNAVSQGYVLDAAVAEARKGLYVSDLGVEWGTAVLFMRHPTGKLFEISPIVPSAQPPLKRDDPQRAPSLSERQTAPAEVPPPQSPVEASPKPAPSQPRDPELSPEKSLSNIPRPSTPVEYRLLLGHGKQVNTVAFSPDGTMVVSGSGGWLADTYPLLVWNVQSGTIQHTLQGHTAAVRSVAISPDGRLLASGAYDSTIGLWDLTTGQMLHLLQGHTLGIDSVAFTPDGTLLVSGAYDKTVRLWQVTTGQILHLFQENIGMIRSVAISPDGALLAAGGDDKVIRFWQLATGQLLHTLQGHPHVITTIAFSPNGAFLVSGSNDKGVRLWESSTGKLLRIFQGHTNWVHSVVFSPDGSLLASGSRDNTLRFWEVATGKPLLTLAHPKGVNGVAFSHDGKFIASACDDQKVRLWKVWS